jgi:hypothetical protein
MLKLRSSTYSYAHKQKKKERKQKVRKKEKKKDIQAIYVMKATLKTAPSRNSWPPTMEPVQKLFLPIKSTLILEK